MNQGMTPTIRIHETQRELELQRELDRLRELIQRETELAHACSFVRRNWPCISAADKLAWFYLYRRSRCGREIIDVKAADLGADQGVTSDAGLSRIKNLTMAGLIKVKSRLKNDKSGVYTVTVLDPFDVGRTKAIAWDGQYELPFEGEPTTLQATSVSAAAAAVHVPVCRVDTDVGRAQRLVTEDPPEEAPEVPPEVPRSKVLTSKEILNYTSTLTSNLHLLPTSNLEGVETNNRGTSDRGSSDTGSAPDLGDVGKYAGSEYDRWYRLIKRRVNCRNLFDGRAKQAARAIVGGTIAESAMVELLENLDTKRKNGELNIPPSAYFNGGLDILLGVRKYKPK